MTLDISHIPVEHTYLSWVVMLFKATKPDSIVISEYQAKEIFCTPDGVTWNLYRGVEIKILLQSSRYSSLTKRTNL